MIENLTKERISLIIKKYDGKIKIDSETEMIVYFNHDSDFISCKLDIFEFYTDVYNYMPRELIIRF